ncbi:ATP-binding protein [Actinokineospora guangxiensis]|uniref:ATP-binding protein n=1 Tax=Actinokineospora guangxiensis TaxID=1490288 RepID=A0ABW0EV98_9PSEU
MPEPAPRHRGDGPPSSPAAGLVVTNLGEGATLHLRVPGLPEVTDARRRLHAWLTAAHLGSDLVDDVVLAAQELLVNAAEHAYLAHHARPVHLLARLTAPRLTVSVTDTGSWQAPALDPGHRGHGLTMVRALADGVEITSLSAGTQVTATFTTGPRGTGQAAG